MRVCFASDLHGRPELYDQLEALLRAETPDVLILGGDLFTDGDIEDPFGTQVAYVHNVFMPRMFRWRAAQPALRIAGILGNHDWLCTRAALELYARAGQFALLDHQAVWPCGPVAFTGYANTPPTPYWVKDFERLDLPGDPVPLTGGAIWDAAGHVVRQALPEQFFHSRPSIAEDLKSASAPSQPWVFVCHAPPHNTGLDRLPHIDHPVGSRAVAEFIAARQPRVALHGHIHESPEVTGAFLERIGATLCINPGQSRTRLHAVLFDPAQPEATLRHTVLR